MLHNTNEVDSLSLRTTNINIRISPLLKIEIIKQGMKMGVNLSDYIIYAIVQLMSGQSETEIEDTPQYKELEEAYKTAQTSKEELLRKVSVLSKQNETFQKQFQEVQLELSKYEAIAEPYKINVGKSITIDGVTYQPKHVSELIDVLLKTFKSKN